MHDAFAHLHVASGYSLRYGASTPAALVERAASLGQPALALTDRDGLYGAVRFVQACDEAGIAPVLGVDLAVGHERSNTVTGQGVQAVRAVTGRTETGRVRTGRASPARGGAEVDPRYPRVTVLARGQGAGVDPGVGWGRLCRLVTQTHLSGERGAPVTSAQLIAEHVVDPRTGQLALLVLLGPASDVGQALLARRPDRARWLLRQWVDVLPCGGVVIEVVCHGGPEGTPASLGHAARLLGLATEFGLPAVLTAAVHHADPGGAVTVDVLDAARRLVPLDTRHLDRVTTAGHLASSAQMYAVARDVARAFGAGVSGGGSGERDRARQLMADTMALAQACALDSRTDLGFGSVHLPEPSALGIAPDESPQEVLAARCRGAIATRYGGAGNAERSAVTSRLEDELQVIAGLGYPTYFMTVAAVCDLIRDLGVRVAARGSGAGSMVNYLLGISGVEPLRHGLLMERFCSPLRAQLPDIDIDVESARRTEIYEHVLERFGGDRVTCVSMMDTYRVRHAIRDVGATLGLPVGEIDAIAKAFPHIRARDVRSAMAELPELRASGLDAPRLRVLFDLVERLDGLPRHIAVHPCGVILSNRELLDRTPVEASWLGFPMSQFDKDDVETLGLLKLDILGIRMQSAMAHAVKEVERVDDIHIDLDDRARVSLEDDRTFRLIRSTHTLGCFQIESPGQRELIGKFGPETFEDLIIDISLFRPGPVKSDMVTPFLLARQHWRSPEYLHPSLEPALKETHGVVVFHEQVLKIVAETTGVTLAQADEVRRALGSPQGQLDVEAWWRPAAAARGYEPAAVDRIWEVLKAFASFGFCKAHAAAFALPTYQSAWLKAHHPAAFLSGVLTHDPGMYPKRLILDDARNLGITILGLDVNASGESYRVEPVVPWSPRDRDRGDRDRDSEVGRVAVGPRPDADLPDGRGYGIRLSLADVLGISDAEVQRILAGQPYFTLADFWHRAQVSRPVVERLVMAGGFDSIYGLSRLSGTFGGSGMTGRRGRVTRRDLLLHVAELDRWSRSVRRSSRRVAPRTSRAAAAAATLEATLAQATSAETRDVRLLAAAQSQGGRPVIPAQAQPTQLTLDLGDTPELAMATGLPEMTGPERVRAELDILGLDASAHIIDFYAPMLQALGVTRSGQLLGARSRSELWVAGVKVATQTPPIRSGRRVVFLTLDDSTGPVDATFFEDVQGPYAATVFHSWMLLVRGILRRTGPKGVSLRATGAWELSGLWEAWSRGGLEAVLEALSEADGRAHSLAAAGAAFDETAGAGAAQSRSSQQVMAPTAGGDAAGGMGGSRRRVLVHASGFKQSPYADIKPAGGDARDSRKLPKEGHAIPDQGAPPRKLWHASPGSSGH
ncbi:MAG: DNA polymerase III subunit alpha [Phycicoccus sp.]|nr:DNA polymerase III subunit alpha [Phycicoccus sp.]